MVFNLHYGNGQPVSKGRYENYLPAGYWEHYYENGNIFSKGYYVDGAMSGYWIRYDEDGKESIVFYF